MPKKFKNPKLFFMVMLFFMAATCLSLAFILFYPSLVTRGFWHIEKEAWLIAFFPFILGILFLFSGIIALFDSPKIEMDDKNVTLRYPFRRKRVISKGNIKFFSKIFFYARGRARMAGKTSIFKFYDKDKHFLFSTAFNDVMSGTSMERIFLEAIMKAADIREIDEE